MRTLIWNVSLICAASSAAFAAVRTTPEIDANTGIAALGLLGGAVLVIRSRRNR